LDVSDDGLRVAPRSQVATARTAGPSLAPILVAAAAAAGITATVAVTAVTGWNRDHPWQATVPRVAVPLALTGVGLWAMRRTPERFGRLLVAAGFLAGIGMLNGSSNPVLYTFGRLAIPFTEVALFYAILAFPSGRLTLRRDRAIVAVMLAAIVALWVPAMLLSNTLELGGPLVDCGGACPDNVFARADHPGAAAILTKLAWLAVCGCMAAATLSVALRYRRASPVLKRGLAVVAAVGAASAFALALLAALTIVDRHLWLTTAAGWAVVASAGVIPVAFAVGLLRARLFANVALQSLIRDLNRPSDAGTFERAVSRAVGDPSLVLARRRADGTLVDLEARPLPVPVEPHRVVSDVDGAGAPVALVHDPALADDVGLFEAVRTAVAVSYDQSRQRERIRRLLADLRASRQRLAVARDAERRRIERDLHDGAQQRLVAVRVRLGVVQSRLHGDPDAAAALLSDVRDELADAVQQLRDFARRIYPPLLESDGLEEALREAAGRSVLPTTVDGAGVGRLSPTVEAAAYFSCLEAMQNADKHAGPGARVRVTLRREDDALEFVIADDGGGFDPRLADHAGGLVNIRDRVESIGGEAMVTSAVGRGTKISCSVPLGASDRPR
jgi:signal transduction histidine kinase